MESVEFEHQARLIAAKISSEMAIAAYSLTEDKDPSTPAAHMMDKFDYLYTWIYRKIVDDAFHKTILEEDKPEHDPVR